MFGLTRTRHRVAAVVAVAAVACAGVSAAWAALSGGTPPTTFAVTLDGELLTTATGYELDGAVVSGKREYTLPVSLRLTDNAGPAQAFQSGQTFPSAKVELIAEDLSVLKTYALANATVVGYRQSASAATSAFTQELVLKSKSLTIG